VLAVDVDVDVEVEDDVEDDVVKECRPVTALDLHANGAAVLCNDEQRRATVDDAKRSAILPMNRSFSPSFQMIYIYKYEYTSCEVEWNVR
jgi:hypothetical protein